MINIEDIIATKRYQVPYPPEALFTTLDESLNLSELVPNCTEWYCISKGDRIRRYIPDPKYYYILDKMSVDATIEDKLKLASEFNKDITKFSNNMLTMYADGTPTEIRVLITQVSELGSECRASCYPALYTRLRKSFPKSELNDFIIQDSKHYCSVFLDELFIGKLGGTAVEDFLKKRFEYKLLINNSTRREITGEIDKLLDTATTEILICGWMGTYYLPKLTQLKNQGLGIKFMIHRPSEARGQPWKSEIEEARKIIISNFGLESMSDAHNIHGRTIIVDNKAIIGSLDMNSASLTGPHTEFAILTDDPEMVRRMRVVFNSKFQPLKSPD